ncbi:hypothetical protein FG386_000953 [Cryptosporidium ryanae]|uniref:uncharacterized protein n=1 Tax=Cryptosporidium ryanae TaxID=515981 RepID=UPI003519E84C|nr:hypothetical protein FG386_000953 [Cryptosporidium ryanae]
MTQALTNSKNRTPTRARGERVYKPGGKKEWRVVFWTHESTKPSRRQCSFSEAKYGKEAASLLSRAVLDYIDVKGVIPDDLHDPPILDPAKKELIEYYSALHESRKASQKRNKPKNGVATVGGASNGENAVKNSSDSTIVPLYTLANSQTSPLSANSFSPIQSVSSTKSESPNELMQKHVNKKERKHLDPVVISGSSISASSPLSFVSRPGNVRSSQTPSDISSSSSSIFGTVANGTENSGNRNLDIINNNNGAVDINSCLGGVQNFVQIPPIPLISAPRDQNVHELLVCGNGNMNGINNSTSASSTRVNMESALSNSQKQANCPAVPNLGFGSFLGIGVTSPSITPPGMFMPSFPDVISSAVATTTLGVANPDTRSLIGQNINHMAAIHSQQLQFCLLQQHLAGSYPTFSPLFFQNCCPPILGFDNHVNDSFSQETLFSSAQKNNGKVYSAKRNVGVFCNDSSMKNKGNIGISNSQQIIYDVDIAQN